MSLEPSHPFLTRGSAETLLAHTRAHLSHSLWSILWSRAVSSCGPGSAVGAAVPLARHCLVDGKKIHLDV